ncbi:PQQ-dependent sugar dehydrogenase [Arthrobacter castelli]|uniref:PQQ-dependent sugar dehydrogenase n=1 Tax=Arthrobacter castelli TaxID=271431 RepID=UPI0004015D06|nr:PQQ-dependent sugar dehydrogenase [Arthrobacter castelli]
MRRRQAWLAAVTLSAVVVSGCSPGSGENAAPGTGEPAPDVSAPASGSSSSAQHRHTESSGPLGGELAVTGTAADSLTSPWSMALLPDGSVLVSERDSAAIKRIDDGEVTMVGTVEHVVPGGEGGLLGIAVAPTFARDRYLYAYYTSASDNRIVRMEYDGGQDPGLGTQEVLLEGIPKATIHNGGRIKFGPDGMLYASTGDATQEDQAQNRQSLSGKILRITPDGDPAPGNPFGDNPVYSLGHRNVQGLAWDSEGRLWASEFGPTEDDELNLIRPGGNYGWPEVTGAPGVDGFIDAQVVWPSTATASPSGMAIVNDVAYIGALRGQRLWEVPLLDGRAGQPVSHFQDDYGRLRDVITGPDGALWVATNGGPEERIIVVEGR